jgi:uncharacterized protein (TIGR02118 family)
MTKMIFLVNRRPGMDADEFRRYWTERHGPIAARMPGVRKYVQHHAVTGPDGAAPEFDGFAEIWWDDAEAMAASLASPEGQAAEADAAGLFDIERMQVFAVEQATIV